MHRRIVFWMAACFAIGFCGTVKATAKRHITEKDLFDFQWCGDPQLSPNGSGLAFVKVTVNAKREGYATSLWMVDAGGAGNEPVQLTNGPLDAAPRWSPDGRTLVFTRAIEKDGKPTPAQLYLLSFAGGEPRQLTSLARGAGNPSFSSRRQAFAFYQQHRSRRWSQARGARKRCTRDQPCDVPHERRRIRRSQASHAPLGHECSFSGFGDAQCVATHPWPIQ